MTDTRLNEEDEMLAAELALGLCEGDEKRSAEARLASEASFADAHRLWQHRAVAIAAVPPEAPRPSLWAEIEARLPGAAANDTAPATGQSPWWRAGAIAASLVAMMLGSLLVVRGAAPPPPPRMIALAAPAPLVAILIGDRQGGVAISFDGTTRRLSIAPDGLALDGRSAELWVIPADQRPRSLGVFAGRSGSSRIAPADLATLLRPDTTLAVSLEPRGGSATGKPTGPVILTGKITVT